MPLTLLHKTCSNVIYLHWMHYKTIALWHSYLRISILYFICRSDITGCQLHPIAQRQHKLCKLIICRVLFLLAAHRLWAKVTSNHRKPQQQQLITFWSSKFRDLKCSLFLCITRLTLTTYTCICICVYMHTMLHGAVISGILLIYVVNYHFSFHSADVNTYINISLK